MNRVTTSIRILGVVTVIAAICGVIYATTFSAIYDIATPLGTDAPSSIDDQIRLTKSANQERQDVDHYWPLTGTQVSDPAVGEHRQISFFGPLAGDPSSAANKGFIYAKDVSGVVELFWEDELGNALQLTAGGALNITSSDLIGTLANNQYFTSVDAGTGTVNLIKANSADVAVIPDGSEMATTAAPTVDADIVNKKYVDDQIAAEVVGVARFGYSGAVVWNTSFGTPNVWQTLDLSGIVGSNRAVVTIKVVSDNTVAYQHALNETGVLLYHVGFNGPDSVTFNNTGDAAYFTLMTDSAGKFSHGATSGTVTITVTLLGYIY